MLEALRVKMSTADIHLKQDGIKEALFEIRFDTPVVPEAVIGRLTDVEAWSEFTPTRMASADLPQQVRMAAPNFRFTPSYELAKGSPNELIRIGPNSLSYHRLAPYPGWDQHAPALKQMLEALFGAIIPVTPVRLGFRYVNALNGNDHLVGSAADLALTVVAGEGESFAPDIFALNYRRQSLPGHIEQVQIATPEYVPAASGEDDFSVLVDIDIFTPDHYSIGGIDNVLNWMDVAHDLLKENFFKLLPEAIIHELRIK